MCVYLCLRVCVRVCVRVYIKGGVWPAHCHMRRRLINFGLTLSRKDARF